MSLISNCAAIALALWLPCLIKGFEIENIETPVKSRADTALVEGLRVDGTGLRCAIVLTTCRANQSCRTIYRKPLTVRWPSCLAIPDLDSVNGTRQLLDMSNGLLQIIKVGCRCIGDFLALPVAESIDKSCGDVSKRSQRHMMPDLTEAQHRQ